MFYILPTDLRASRWPDADGTGVSVIQTTAALRPEHAHRAVQGAHVCGTVWQHQRAADGARNGGRWTRAAGR